jgi:hypothetical protein
MNKVKSRLYTKRFIVHKELKTSEQAWSSWKALLAASKPMVKARYDKYKRLVDE